MCFLAFDFCRFCLAIRFLSSPPCLFDIFTRPSNLSYLLTPSHYYIYSTLLIIIFTRPFLLSYDLAPPYHQIYSPPHLLSYLLAALLIYHYLLSLCLHSVVLFFLCCRICNGGVRVSLKPEFNHCLVFIIKSCLLMF